MRSKRRGLLLNSANDEFPDGLANSSGLVGKNLMVQLNQAAWGMVEDEVRSYKGPPSLAISEHWNYADAGKDYFGGWSYMSQGPLPITWAKSLAGGRGLWGQALIDEMARDNHSVGLKMVGEVLPDERNRVTLADETDHIRPARPAHHVRLSRERKGDDRATPSISWTAVWRRPARPNGGRKWTTPAT